MGTHGPGILIGLSTRCRFFKWAVTVYIRKLADIFLLKSIRYELEKVIDF